MHGALIVVDALEAALKTKLSANGTISAQATGGVWNTIRAQGGAFPVVVFRMVSHQDGQTFSSDGVENATVDVKVICEDSASSMLGTIADAIHTALERQALTITGYSHLQTLRTGRIAFPEVVDGVTYWHQGGTYKIWMAKN